MSDSRDFAASEDAVQEALIAAADRWPQGGVPDNPLGGLIKVARRRMTDFVRSDISRRKREAVVAEAAPAVVAPATPTRPSSIPTKPLSCCSCAATRRSRLHPRSR